MLFDILELCQFGISEKALQILFSVKLKFFCIFLTRDIVILGRPKVDVKQNLYLLKTIPIVIVHYLWFHNRDKKMTLFWIQ